MESVESVKGKPVQQNDDELMSSPAGKTQLAVAEAAASDTVNVDPASYSFDELVAGIRPTKRYVRVLANAHLLARLEELVVEITTADPSQNVDDKIDEFETLQAAAYRGTDFVIIGRSKEWVKRFRARTAEALGVDVGVWKFGDMAVDEKYADARQAVLLEQLAAQIEKPEGATAEGLAKLGEINEGELDKLMVKMTQANSEAAGSAGVLTLDFSPRRSTKTGTNRS